MEVGKGELEKTHRSFKSHFAGFQARMLFADSSGLVPRLAVELRSFYRINFDGSFPFQDPTLIAQPNKTSRSMVRHDFVGPSDGSYADVHN